MFPIEEPTAKQVGFVALLKNRSFLALWIGQLLSQVADKILLTLLIALLAVYPTATGTENSMRSVLLLTFTLPAILFGSVAGIFVDRLGKKLILVVSNVIRALLIFTIPFLPREFVILLLITFVISTVTQFFAPAEQAAIPLLIPRENLLAANALFTTTSMGGFIVGFAIGEPLLSLSQAWGGDKGQELLVGGLYLLAAVTLQAVSFKETVGNAHSMMVNPWQEMKAGFWYLKQNRLVWDAILQLTTLYCVIAALTVLTFSLAPQIGLQSEKQYGFIVAAAGIGIMLGAGVLGHWGDVFRHKPLPLFGFLTMAFALAAFSFVSNLWLGLGLSAVLGLGGALVGVPMQTLIQRETPTEMHGKVFGFQNNLINIALSAPLAITGPITDAVSNAVGSEALGLRIVLVGMSAIVCVVGIWAWNNTRGVLRDVI
ncbi:MFS transporter [Chlorogloea sp. CCALA 695]|uniref:MFS transporter n=1 Tax=Chlorogloea sp. CCALA 695 TaxID=2107693 RepID=UPI000D070AAD|nr:MFS transporter [Chlorogloea sp. CCALA 695]PSB32383.1 MFS transporter [Chlorogloea sp. CCALA 695]